MLPELFEKMRKDEHSLVSGNYEILDHTADLAIRVWGETWEELVVQAIKGMISQIVDIRNIRIREYSKLIINAENQEELLLKGLKETLFLVEKGRVFSSVEVNVDKFSHLSKKMVQMTLILGGEEIDPQRHDICLEIKAVTRHGFGIRKEGPYWITQILFDV
jgi:SHS2 domain-containing protein